MKDLDEDSPLLANCRDCDLMGKDMRRSLCSATDEAVVDIFDFAKRMETELTRKGYKVWIDSQIRQGYDWRSEIAEAIDNSDALIFCVSPLAVQSKYCKEELYFASGLKVPIFPVVKAEQDESFKALDGGAKVILQRLQWADFDHKEFEDALQCLLPQLDAKIRRCREEHKRIRDFATDVQSAVSTASDGHSSLNGVNLARIVSPSRDTFRDTEACIDADVHIVYDASLDPDSSFAASLRDALIHRNMKVGPLSQGDLDRDTKAVESAKCLVLLLTQ